MQVTDAAAIAKLIAEIVAKIAPMFGQTYQEIMAEIAKHRENPPTPSDAAADAAREGFPD